MKLWCVAVGGVGIFAALVGARKPSVDWTIFVTGDSRGYLSPCGCTEPMSGGIVRRASVVRSAKGQVLLIDNGGMIAGIGKQDRMKAQTAIESLLANDVAAINFTPDLAALGFGDALALSSLGQHHFVSAQISNPGDLDILRWIEKGPFLISGVSEGGFAGIQSLSIDRSVSEFVDQAQATGKLPILMVDGPQSLAEKLTAAHRELLMAVYSSVGNAAREMAGKTPLVTPGARGRFVVRLGFEGGTIGGYQAIELGPDLPNDKQAMQIYQRYLKRVDSSDLLEQVPRLGSAAFSGSAKCGSCHGKALDIWQHSGHAHALRTLIDHGHGRDPDCVSCHVVGLSSLAGFRSVAKTPELANVGCEACHGAGEAHSKQPMLAKLAKVSSSTCDKCHTADNSPNFNFATYWAKIRH
jgi:hypothetical protein